MGRPVSHPLVLDAGALIALESRDRRVAVLIDRTRELGQPIFIPVGALAQAWRDGSRQARLSILLSSRDVAVESLTEARAKATGELCGARRRSDVIDASVVLLARQFNATIATSDPDDLYQFDSTLTIVPI